MIPFVRLKLFLSGVGGIFYDQLAFAQALEKALVAGGAIEKSEKVPEKHTKDSEKTLENQEDKKGENDDV